MRQTAPRCRAGSPLRTGALVPELRVELDGSESFEGLQPAPPLDVLFERLVDGCTLRPVAPGAQRSLEEPLVGREVRRHGALLDLTHSLTQSSRRQEAVRRGLVGAIE